MNIQKADKSVLFFFFAIVFFVSFNVQNGRLISEISSGIEVFDRNYTYSEKSMFKLGDIDYSLRSKAFYDSNGQIFRLITFKPEGILEYNKQELLKDRNLVDYFDFPFFQNYIYSGGEIIKSGNEKINVLKVTEDCLIGKADGIVQFYKLK